MSDPNPKAEEGKLNPLQLIELSTTIGRTATQLAMAGELGDTEGVQKVMTSSALEAALRHILVPLSQGLPVPGIAMPDDPKWPSAISVYNDYFGINIVRGTHSTGERPPPRGHLTKPLIIAHSKVHNGSFEENFLTLEKIIEVMRQHFNVQLPGGAEKLEEVIDLRQPAVPGESTYQIRVDERKLKEGVMHHSHQPEASERSIAETFNDPNRIAMTLRECLILCFFYWLSTNKEQHLFQQERINQVCAGTVTLSGAECFQVRTREGGLTIEKTSLDTFSQGRLRQVALLPANLRKRPLTVQPPKRETARISLPSSASVVSATGLPGSK